ncbi:Retrovirus-related Pol polyprotein from transposon TNT 1-94 [Melia azedarach]|uniref:Retrovirus-related Pol polyprotein from transposon TNT 1-94 n=1 Tax=Melia azedarach TaxID=155640 RepID=A0ACC1X7Q6_MELAZ|nr:Retrovirus-related Pol polyprotein from transposon TNT 1-94 [Melia azedarach]
MASGSTSYLAVPMFTGENYQIWVVKMKSYLKSIGLWDAVETGRDPPPLRANPTIAQMKQYEEELLKKDKALTVLHSALADHVFTGIMALETAKEVWDQLKEQNEGSDRVKAVRLLTLKREFENLKMKEAETIKVYSSKVMELVNQMRLLGEVIEQHKIVEKMLISLPEKFEAKVSVIEESHDLKKLTVVELISKLQVQEQRTSVRSESQTEGAFQAKHSSRSFNSKDDKRVFGDKSHRGKVVEAEQRELGKGRFPPCSHCKKTNHHETSCWKKAQCRVCKKIGHIAKYCKLKRQQNQHFSPQQTDQKQQANVMEEKQPEDHIFMAVLSSEAPDKHSWLLDSGCTNHMTSNSEYFSTLDTTVRVPVRLGNGDVIESAGKGTISIPTSKGIKFINDVLLVPNLDQNLLSVGQMMHKGYSLFFKDKACVISDSSGDKVVVVPMIDKSFIIHWHSNISLACKTVVDESWLWHKRFGHANFKSLKLLQEKCLVDDMFAVNICNEVCESCQMGKLHRFPFPSQAKWRATEKLEMTWVYFMNNKSQAFSCFKKFKSLAETQSGVKVKKLRTDNGKEYISNEFDKFCEDAGIQHQLTVPYSPQQNGVCERKNRTLLEMARSMMHEKNLPKKFWAEAVYTSVYLQNRLPTHAIEGKTPIEAWSGLKPSVGHLKVFGSVCYVHVPDVKRDKLSKKASKGIFLGYSSQAKGYRIFDLETKKIVVRRDVKVDESSECHWQELDVETTSSRVRRSDFQRDTAQEIDGVEEIDVQSTTDSPVLRTCSLSDVYARCNVAVIDPSNFSEASNYEEWNVAMRDEIVVIEKNKTWELVDRPLHKQVVGVKWVYRTKFNADGSIHKHKARLVVKGYAQQQGIDYGDTFAPVARLDTIKLLIALAAQNRWKIFHLDIKSAFLNSYLKEEIFIEQPEGFKVNGEEDKVYKLNKALYGLKQAPRAWYSRIDEFLCASGFRRSCNDATLYIKTSASADTLIISMYVDDLLIIGSRIDDVNDFKQQLYQKFEMTDLGKMKFFLGLQVHQTAEGIFVSQQAYVINMLKKFRMQHCKPTSTPLIVNQKLTKFDGDTKADAFRYRSLVGSLLYLSATRSDIMFATSLLSRFMQNPSQVHFGAGRRVLRYLKGTHDLGILFKPEAELNLFGYVDSDWAGCIDDGKSTSGYAFSVGSGMFSWCSKKQDVVAQSTAEAEFIAAAAGANQCIWLRKMLIDLGFGQINASPIFCDSKSAIAIAKNPVQHGKTKHMKVKFHFLREAERDQEVCLIHCKSEEQVADILTKALPKTRFEKLREKLGVSKQNLKEEFNIL